MSYFLLSGFLLFNFLLLDLFLLISLLFIFIFFIFLLLLLLLLLILISYKFIKYLASIFFKYITSLFKSTNKKYLRYLLIFFISLTFFIYIDSINIREGNQNNIPLLALILKPAIYKINIDLWITMFASIFAVLGTYLFTRLENTKALNSQQLLANKQILNSLTLLQALEFLFTENMNLQKIDGHNNNDKYIAFPVNKDEFSYLNLLKEINLINNIFSKENIKFNFTNKSIIYHPFDNNDATFQITLSSYPKPHTYINSYFLDTLRQITLKNIVGFDSSDVSGEFIENNKASIINKISQVQLHYKEPSSDHSNSDSQTIFNEIQKTESEISILISNVYKAFIQLDKKDNFNNKHEKIKIFIESIEKIQDLYALIHNKFFKFNPSDSIATISIIDNQNNFFSSEYNSLVILKISDFQEFIDIKPKHF